MDFKRIAEYIANALKPKKVGTPPINPNSTDLPSARNYIRPASGMISRPSNGQDINIGQLTGDIPGIDGMATDSGLKIIGLEEPIINKSGSGMNNILDNPEIKQLLDSIKTAQGTLNGPAPILQGPKVNPLESALSVLFASQNPFAAGKTLDVPNQLAKQRADLANENLINQYNAQKQAATSQINTSAKLIDYALDRDAVSERVLGQLKAKAMEGATKKEIATLQNNTQLIKTLANLEGNGGITQPAVAAIYMQMGYEPEEANTIANNVIQSIIKNPSLQMKIKQAQVEVNQGKLEETQNANDNKIILSTNSSYEDRLAAGIRKAQRGDPLFAGMTIDQLEAWAEKKGANTRYVESGIDLRESQEAKNQIETQYKTKLLEFLPAEKASQIARNYANIDHLRNMDQMALDKFDFQMRKDILAAKDREYKTILSGLSTEYGTIQSDNNSLRTSRKELETQLHKIKTEVRDGKTVTVNDEDAGRYAFLMDEIERYDATINANKKRQASLHQAAEATRNDMRADLEPTQTHELERTNPQTPADVLTQASTKCPPGADCSAFTQNTMKNLGISIPRTAIAQYKATQRVAGRQNLQPGDLVFFDNGKRDSYNTDGKKVGSGYVNHVGIYLGDGQFIADPGKSSDKREAKDLEEYIKSGMRYMGGGRITSEQAEPEVEVTSGKPKPNSKTPKPSPRKPSSNGQSSLRDSNSYVASETTMAKEALEAIKQLPPDQRAKAEKIIRDDYKRKIGKDLK